MDHGHRLRIFGKEDIRLMESMSVTGGNYISKVYSKRSKKKRNKTGIVIVTRIPEVASAKQRKALLKRVYTIQNL